MWAELDNQYLRIPASARQFYTILIFDHRTTNMNFIPIFSLAEIYGNPEYTPEVLTPTPPIHTNIAQHI